MRLITDWPPSQPQLTTTRHRRKVWLFCQVADHEPDVGNQVRVVIGDCGDRFDRAIGNHRRMRRHLSGDVVEGRALVIFEDDLVGFPC